MSEINAIATNNYILHNIDAKKLYVQEPLFTANSGDAVYVGWRPDETVLWSGTASKNDTMQLSEPFSAFQYLDIYGSIVQDNGTHNMLPSCRVCVDDVVLPASFNIAGWSWWGAISNYKIGMYIGTYADSYSAIQHAGGVFQGYWDSQWQAAENNNLKINRVIGVNRKENV